MKEKCSNSRTSDGIDMKLGSVTKLQKKNKTTSTKFDNDAMPENCDVFVIYRIYDKFRAIWKTDSGCSL